MAADLESRQVKRAINNVGGEEATEEHDFRKKEDPHAEAVGLALLLHVLELMRKPRRMRVVDRHISHESPYCARSRKRLWSPRESPQNFQWAAEKAWSIPALSLPMDSGQRQVRTAWTRSSRLAVSSTRFPKWTRLPTTLH